MNFAIPNLKINLKNFSCSFLSGKGTISHSKSSTKFSRKGVIFSFISLLFVAMLLSSVFSTFTGVSMFVSGAEPVPVNDFTALQNTVSDAEESTVIDLTTASPAEDAPLVSTVTTGTIGDLQEALTNPDINSIIIPSDVLVEITSSITINYAVTITVQGTLNVENIITNNFVTFDNYGTINNSDCAKTSFKTHQHIAIQQTTTINTT
ncbi:hypothetical protein [Candidatus Bathycorpusculum sp.]|uniref:hypothetical protein n=1 Tax=Candidatus Bathycorpusculum sp. TaxID=2994959 RepID=UPI002823C061|nr:hypothetical protein [Candidatus Termitimicrobium sp.]MCL2432871.1 hypothetical protein [Candidatus Termitimicrobium sp.]